MHAGLATEAVLHVVAVSPELDVPNRFCLVGPTPVPAQCGDVAVAVLAGPGDSSRCHSLRS